MDPPKSGIETAPGFAVDPQNAEAARRALLDADLLAPGLSPRHEDEQVVFPLAGTATQQPQLQALIDRLDATLTTTDFKRRAPREADYRTRLQHLPAELHAELPRAHDVVGDIAVVKLHEPLQGHKHEIARALLATHPRLRTVALDHGVTGEDRVRELEILTGGPTLTTTHREHGLQLHVELDQVYFSPRLATERAQLLRRIRPRQRILDLFAGIGAFVCLALRASDPSAVCAVDRNPHAIRLLEKNLNTNRLPHESVGLLVGDARHVAPRTGDWDHVVMNLPHDAHRFLDVAAECVAPQGEIHLYAIIEREEEHHHLERALADLHEKTGAPWTLAERRHVRQYAPTMDGLRFTLKRV